VRGERTREVTGRHRVESINGDGFSKGRRRSGQFMRGNEEEATTHQFNCSHAETGGVRHQPKEVALGHREVENDWGDGPNRLVQPNGPAWQLGWRRVSGQIQGFE
jgi:hypothetical protein